MFLQLRWSRNDARTIAAAEALKTKDRPQRPYLAAKMLMDRKDSHRLGFHVQVPQLDSHVVPGRHVPAVSAEPHI